MLVLSMLWVATGWEQGFTAVSGGAIMLFFAVNQDNPQAAARSYAVPGGTVTVHYVGVEYDTGDQFDSSWDRGQTIEFPLRGLIQGWQEGIPGMKVGGRRQLVCPPHLAYGPAGGGHRLSGKTLIFVIDLLAVR